MSAPRGRDQAPPPPSPPPPPLLLLPPRRLLLLQTLLLRGAPRRALRHQRPARLLPSAAPSGLARGLRGGRRCAGGALPMRGSLLTAGRPAVRASAGSWLSGSLRGQHAWRGWNLGCALWPGRGAALGQGSALRSWSARLQHERVTAAPSGRPPAHVSSSASLRPCASPPPTTGGGRGVFYARAARGRGAGGGPGPEPAQ